VQHGSRSRNLPTQGTQNDFFDTLACTRQATKLASKRQIEAAIIGRSLVCRRCAVTSRHTLCSQCSMDKNGMNTPSRWCGNVVTKCYWKMSLYSVLNDWTNRKLQESNNRFSNFEYFTLFCFFMLVSNQYFAIVLFLWSSSTYNAHINNSSQDSHTKTFSELHQFWSRLEVRSYQPLYNLLYKLLYNLLKNICNTNQSLVKSAWDGY